MVVVSSVYLYGLIWRICRGVAAHIRNMAGFGVGWWRQHVWTYSIGGFEVNNAAAVVSVCFLWFPAQCTDKHGKQWYFEDAGYFGDAGRCIRTSLNETGAMLRMA